MTVAHILPLLLALGACQPPPGERHAIPDADPLAGLQVMRDVGCASCHHIPGIGWPQGRVGPALQGFADQGLIAGRLPNRPDLLAAYVRDAPSLVPGSTMPAMPVSRKEARDVAAYLYTLAGD